MKNFNLQKLKQLQIPMSANCKSKSKKTNTKPYSHYHTSEIGFKTGPRDG